MKIIATFVTYEGNEDDHIELVHAWDEYARDSNPDGYAETLANSLSPEVKSMVEVTINVPDEPIRNALNPKPLTFQVWETNKDFKAPTPGWNPLAALAADSPWDGDQ